MKVSELSGVQLNWAVAKAERRTIDYFRGIYKPSTDWAQGGPIIEREEIGLQCDPMGIWVSVMVMKSQKHGQTPLIAAMRCYVASKLGDEIEVPEGLR